MANNDGDADQISLDESQWTQASDFYRSFAAATSAPKWFGNNLDALNDALSGGICDITPASITVLNLALEKCPAGFQVFWGRVLQVCAAQDVQITIRPSDD